MEGSKTLILVIGLVGIVLALWLLWERGFDPNSCESRCATSEACMSALDLEGIAPYGSTRGDRILCNGICAALRRQMREMGERAEQMGLEGPLPHPCLP